MLQELLLNERDRIVLDEALNLYINIGLGNVEQVCKVMLGLNAGWQVLFEGDCVQLLDSDSRVVCAFGLQSKLGENHGGWEWASRLLHERKDLI